MSAPRRLQIGLAALAVVGGVCTVVVMLGGHHNVHRGVYALLTLGIAWGFTATGLYAWRQSPSSNTGPLMIAVGFSGLVKSLAFSNNSTVFAIASIFEVLIYGLLVHLLLSFPAGRLEGGVDRALVVITYINVTVVQVAAFVFSQPSSEGCTRCPTNPISLHHAAGRLGAGRRRRSTSRSRCSEAWWRSSTSAGAIAPPPSAGLWRPLWPWAP